MPKYNITTTQVITTVYDETEIEAETQADAERMAEEMAEEDEIGQTSTDTTYKFVTEKLPDDAETKAG